MQASPIPRTLLASLLALTLTAAALLPLAAVADEDDEEDEQDEDERGEGKRGEGRQDPDRRARDEARRERDDDKDDDHDDKSERDVETKVERDGLEIDLKRRAASNESHVHMGFQFSDARFRIQFQGRENDTRSQMKLEARFGHVFEFRDADGDQRYDLGEEIVSAWSLGDEGDDDVDATGRAEWQTPTSEPLNAAGQSGQKITAQANLGGSGVFELRFYVFGDFVDFGNSTLRPTGAKIDIEIRDYPFTADDTRLGLFLETRAHSKFKWSHDHGDIADDEDGVSATNDVDGKPVSLLFTWKETATVDGNDTAVLSTLLRSRTETENREAGGEFQRRDDFALSYSRGDLVVHDPEAFVSIQSLFTSLPIGDPMLLSAGAAAAALLVVTTLVPRTRRR